MTKVWLIIFAAGLLLTGCGEPSEQPAATAPAAVKSEPVAQEPTALPTAPTAAQPTDTPAPSPTLTETPVPPPTATPIGAPAEPAPAAPAVDPEQVAEPVILEYPIPPGSRPHDVAPAHVAPDAEGLRQGGPDPGLGVVEGLRRRVAVDACEAEVGEVEGREDVDVQVRDALADAVVQGHERAGGGLRIGGRPAGPP